MPASNGTKKAGLSVLLSPTNAKACAFCPRPWPATKISRARGPRPERYTGSGGVVTVGEGVSVFVDVAGDWVADGLSGARVTETATVGVSGLGGVVKGVGVSVTEATNTGVSLISTMGVDVCTVGHALALAVSEGAVAGRGRRVGGGADVAEAVSVTGNGEGNTPAMGVGREQAVSAANVPTIAINR